MSDPRQDNYKARRTHKNTAKDSYKARKNTQKYSYRVPKKRIATKLGHTKNPAAGCLKKIATKLQSWKDKVHQHDCILTNIQACSVSADLGKIEFVPSCAFHQAKSATLCQHWLPLLESTNIQQFTFSFFDENTLVEFHLKERLATDLAIPFSSSMKQI